RHLLKELVPSIRKTAEMVEEVAAASDEQASGVAQINRAMNQVDRVTQQNASAAEELSHTARQMAERARSLRQLMDFFRVADRGDKDEGRSELADVRPAPALAPVVALHRFEHAVADDGSLQTPAPAPSEVPYLVPPTDPDFKRF
ncbi:MAG: hypothetical protein GY856_48345, partial [bacterium]|nr:hypothetical protein [bacterium]